MEVLLPNRLMIELSISDFQAGISVVSPLVEEQSSTVRVLFGMIPMGEINTVKRYNRHLDGRFLTISGETDPIIPYEGGKGVVGYRFLPAEQSAFLWAQVNGYQGEQIATDQGEPYAKDPSCLLYRYVDANVTHVKVQMPGMTRVVLWV